MADPRGARRKFQFSLEWRKQANRKVIDFLDGLVAARNLTNWIVDMYRLHMDLVDGNKTVLVELYPHFAEDKQSNDVIRLIDARFDALIATFENKTFAAQPAQPAGLKPLSTNKTIAMPTFDDEDITLVATIDPKAAGQATSNFFASAGL